MSQKTGKLWVIEGLDGAGKTDLLAYLFGYLIERLGQEQVVLSYEPFDPAAAGDYIRKALRQEVETDEYTMALAFALNRRDHWLRWIEPETEAGKLVLCDRYLMSSFVYQVGKDVSTRKIAEMNGTVFLPDATFWLKVSPQIALERLKARGKQDERYERDLPIYAERYQRQFFAMRASGLTMYEIDADAPQGDVFEQVKAIADQRLSALESQTT